MRSVVLALLAFLILSPSASRAQHVELPSFATRQLVLPNGLDVYLEHDPSSPVVAVAVAYRGGSAENPVDRAGLAHLTEHVTFQGTRDIREDELIATLERAGVRDFNGVTYLDDVLYWASGPRDSVSTILWIEAQRMAYVLDHANETTVAHQRLVVQREWAEHVGDHAGSGLGRLLMRSLFPATHPYSRAGDATPSDIARLTLRDVQWFYQQQYRPSRARLVVSGDVSLEESERLVRALFGGIVDRGAPHVARRIPLPASPRNRLFLVRAPVPTETLTIAWVTPGYFEPLDAELDVVSRLLCGSESSALSSRLIRRRRVAVDVSCHQASQALASTFSIDVALSDGVNAVEVLTEVVAAVNEAGSTPPSASALELARASMVEYVGRRARDASERAQMLARFDVAGSAASGRYSASADLARYVGVTETSVMAALRLLQRTGRVAIVRRPDPNAPDEGVVVSAWEAPL